MIDGLRRQVAGRLFRGRVRLGDGAHLDRIGHHDLEDIRRRFPMPKFFILGHARSGTSFLARLIRLHPAVHCEWQTQFFSERGPIPYFTAPAFRHWLQHPSNKWVAGWDPTPALLRVCLDTILEREAQRVGKRIVGDKSPNENGPQAIRWLAAVYPDARVIYIVRDGRDTILSKRIQAFIDQPQSLSRQDRRVRRDLIEDPKPFLARERSIFTPAWLEASAKGWAVAVQESVAAGRELFGEGFLVVRYEDLLEDPLTPLRQMWSFLGAERPGADVEASVRAKVQENPEAEWHESSSYAFVRLLPRGVRGGWKALFTPTDAARFEAAAGEALAAYGYQTTP
jgi:hypothetical protein